MDNQAVDTYNAKKPANGNFLLTPDKAEPSTNGQHLPTPARGEIPAIGVHIPTPETATVLANGVRLPPSEHANQHPIVLIPTSSTGYRPSNVTANEEPASKAKDDASRKRKRDVGPQVILPPSQIKDQRAESDEKVLRLQEVIDEIFEADDLSQPDTSGAVSSTRAQYFLSVFHQDREVNTLAPASHIKLESSMQKVIMLGRLEEIPIDHLHRLQGLSEGALTSAESADLNVDPEWSADGFESWAQRLDAADLGLRSARTIVRMMTGGRQEKHIYSEELLQSVIRVVQKVLECIAPIIEARSSASPSTLFDHASSHKKVVTQLLHDASKVMGLLAKLLAKEEMAETIITPIEFFAVKLLFVENAPNEKDSVLGIQKFEILRRTAMDLISVIFSRYPSQRSFLFDEILTSLQRLPTSRQTARQFKLADGKAIQLVSALIMRLVQTSATPSALTKKKKSLQRTPVADDDSHSEVESTGAPDVVDTAPDSDALEESDEATDPGGADSMRALAKAANTLCDSASKSAQHAIWYLVQRAQTASKTGDQPHRQLLDIFVEDLITVLSLPEWPAAELLLRAVLGRSIAIIENPKSLAPAKNMALELLGTMGSAISELVSTTQHAARSLENQDSDFSGYLRQMLDDYTDGSLEFTEVLMWNGPYHAVVEHLQSQDADDLQPISAQSYYLAQWAKAASSTSFKAGPESEKLAFNLRKMLSGAEWVNSGYAAWSLANTVNRANMICSSVEAISDSQSQIAYSLTVLNMDFCRRFDYILKILLDSVTSEQITVRSRGLKSVTQMLEKDPSLLDRARSVTMLILKCAADTSSMVRDAALTLIGKCIALRPALESEFLKHVVNLTNDPATGVRKRSMKLLKDIYLRNSNKDVKATIGDSLLQRAKDLDNGVSDLARQTFEEIWISPFWTFSDLADESVQNKISLQDQICLIVKTAQRSEAVRSVLIFLLKEILSTRSKNATANFKVCKSLVVTAFEIMIDPGELQLEQRQILQMLTVFAQANARLFTSDQLQFLQPYIANLSSLEDLDLFRSVVIIFRCVLPVLSTVQHGLLQEIQKTLLGSVSKLSKAELNEVAECLWTINGTLQNTERLLNLTISVLKNLHALANAQYTNPEQKDNIKRVRKYIQIAGYFGKHCDFESYSGPFEKSLTWWNGGSVAGLIVQSVKPFAGSDQPLSLRAEALDSIGLVCQSWPYQFTQQHISSLFEDTLRDGEPILQEMVLSSFRDFFAKIERQSEVKIEEDLTEADADAGVQLKGSMTASDRDGASALIAQRFLKDVLSIALASQGSSALFATEVVASINRQGLVHPKESGPALVALETSTNPTIADVAFTEHRILHQQHESMFEREYMRAIQEAFKYQKEVVKDILGYTTQPYAAKLGGMWEVIKTSKGKYQKKFLSNYCSKIDFDVTKMDMSGTPPNTLQYSRFLTENLAFFDYTRLDELLHTFSCMEKIVADTGSGLAHSISTEVFRITVETEPSIASEGAQQTQGPNEAATTTVDELRLRQLTTASIILSSLWEARTYLRRLYGQTSSQQRRESVKGKTAAKDTSKAPTRVQGVTGDKLVTIIADKVASLDSQETMMQQCRDFVELLSIDSEVKITAESEESNDRPETPEGDDDEERDTPMSGGSRTLKRKGSVSVSGTPMKKKKSRPSLGRRKSSKRNLDEDEDWE